MGAITAGRARPLRVGAVLFGLGLGALINIPNWIYQKSEIDKYEALVEACSQKDDVVVDKTLPDGRKVRMVEFRGRPSRDTIGRDIAVTFSDGYDMRIHVYPPLHEAGVPFSEVHLDGPDMTVRTFSYEAGYGIPFITCPGSVEFKNDGTSYAPFGRGIELVDANDHTVHFYGGVITDIYCHSLRKSLPCNARDEHDEVKAAASLVIKRAGNVNEEATRRMKTAIEMLRDQGH